MCAIRSPEPSIRSIKDLQSLFCYTLNMRKRLYIIVVGVLIIGLAVGYFFGYDIGYEKAAKTNQKAPATSINSFEDCVKAGYQTIQAQTFPPITYCYTPDGKSFKQ